MDPFRNSYGRNVFQAKYAQGQYDTWGALARRCVEGVCGGILPTDSVERLIEHVTAMKFIPGGRYLYYAGRPARFWQNCYIFIGEEDTREEWGRILQKSSDALMSGGGIGTDYSVFRERGSRLTRTGGDASGPIPLMCSVNEVGRNVMQGGSRRSALYASLNWLHGDAAEFLHVKDWHKQHLWPGGPTLANAKAENCDFPAPLDMTNISLNYDDAFLSILAEGNIPPTFMENCRQAMETGEPGFSFNFREKERETGRNACTEVTSADDSDVCNLASLNLSRIESKEELAEIASLGSQFLVCGTIRGELPFEKVRRVREKNRRLGLGLMGMHEWLLMRGGKYEVTKELRDLLWAWEVSSENGANSLCDARGLNRPVAYRAIAPTGTLASIAGTTGGIEPLFAVAYKRRYLVNNQWQHQYIVDPTAEFMVREYGLKPDEVETAYSLAENYEARIRFQAAVQDYLDQAISSTINLPAWGSQHNNEDRVSEFARLLARYAPRLRGFTCYPDGARGGQPLTEVSYKEALRHKDTVYREGESCKGGVCGL